MMKGLVEREERPYMYTMGGKYFRSAPRVAAPWTPAEVRAAQIRLHLEGLAPPKPPARSSGRWAGSSGRWGEAWYSMIQYSLD